MGRHADLAGVHADRRLDRRGVESSSRIVQHQPAENGQIGHNLADRRRHAARGCLVILEQQTAHSGRLCGLGKLQRSRLPRAHVGRTVGMRSIAPASSMLSPLSDCGADGACDAGSVSVAAKIGSDIPALPYAVVPRHCGDRKDPGTPFTRI